MRLRKADFQIHHSSNELYGSDRSLVSLVGEAVRRELTVDVRLPGNGPLTGALTSAGASVTVDREVVLRRSRPIRTLRDVCVGGASHLRTSGMSHPRLLLSNTSSAITPLFSSQRSVPWVVIVREYYSSAPERLAFQALFSRTAGIICTSESVRQQFDSSFLRKRPNAVVHSGADLHQFLSIDRSNCLPELRETRILCVGRLLPWKGQDLLLDAAALLPAEAGPIDIRLVGAEFGGAGELSEQLMRRTGSLPPHVTATFAGESQNVAEHYEWADIVVVPSRKPEPFGKVVVEAMASGCTVVASDHGGPAEVVQNGATGVLFEPNSPEQLSFALAALALKPALRASMGRAGREASIEWSGDRAAGRILDFLQPLLTD